MIEMHWCCKTEGFEPCLVLCGIKLACQQQEKQLQGLSSILNSFTVLLKCGGKQLHIGRRPLGFKCITNKRGIPLRTQLLPNFIIWFEDSLGDVCVDSAKDLILNWDHKISTPETVSIPGMSSVICDK